MNSGSKTQAEGWLWLGTKLIQLWTNVENIAKLQQMVKLASNSLCVNNTLVALVKSK